jgi:hypothetical protein
MFTRQDAAMAALTTAITNEYAEKMIQMALGKYVTPSKQSVKKLSTQAIICRHEFLSDNQEPLYSVA